MTVDDLIGAYITAVATRLPRQQRNDVAFELRALLNEEVQARAEAAGQSADEALALEVLRQFGAPAEVAARYRPTLTIIDPTDGHLFVRASVIGLALIWGAGLVINLQHISASGISVLSALGQWWSTSVIPSLWWPGVVVVWLALAAWVRRRWPPTPSWTPPKRSVQADRAALALGLIGILFGLAALIRPDWVLDVFFGGRAAPAAYEALTYTPLFLQRQAPWLLGLILLNLPLLLAVIVRGGWSAQLRRIDTGLSLLTCAAMIWTVLDGPVLAAPISDQTAKAALLLLAALTLITLSLRAYRRVRPRPNQHLRT